MVQEENPAAGELWHLEIFRELHDDVGYRLLERDHVGGCDMRASRLTEVDDVRFKPVTGLVEEGGERSLPQLLTNSRE